MSRGTRTVPRSPGSLVRGAGRIVRAGLFLVLALVALTLSVPDTARALGPNLNLSCKITGDDGYSHDSPGASGESIIPAVQQWSESGQTGEDINDTSGMVTGAVKMPKSPDSYTFYEMNAMRGMVWTTTFKGRGDASRKNGEDDTGADKCSVMDFVNNGVANMVFNGTKILSRSAISIKELASNPSPLKGLYAGRNNAVTTLEDNVFRPAVPAMILLTGIWVFTKWRRQEMREVWSGVGWACLTTIAVIALLAGGGKNSNYHKVINEADAGIANFNSALAETVLAGASGKMQPPCDLPDTEKHNRGLRSSSCAMYDTLVFRPWALGQFGENGANCIFRKDGGAKLINGVCTLGSAKGECDFGKGVRCEDLRVKQAVSQSTTNFDQFPLQGNKKEIDKEIEQWMPIRIDVAGGYGLGYPDKSPRVADQHVYAVPFDDWAGRNAGGRVGLAFYSLVAALIVGIMVIVLSALTLLWHSVTLILIIMLPLIATLGIHPSQQKLLKGWLQSFIHSFVLRAGFGIILTVLLLLYQMILPARIPLGMQLLMLLLVTVAVVMMLKKLIAGNFSPQIAGAQDALGVGDMPGAVAAKAVPMAGSVGQAAAKGTGRVAGSVARGMDNAVLKGRLRKGGWIPQNNSGRQQRKSARQARVIQNDSFQEAEKRIKEREAEANGSEQTPTGQQPPRRTGRVSQGNTTPPPAANPTPTAAPAPAPQQPAPQPEPPRPPRVQPPQQPVVQQPAQPNPPQLPPQRPPGDGNRLPR
ncbi:hypothetical protein ABZ946_06960 [Streptomyces sp. NPDC046324]|uniref:hypothetical protein n=1 Tax=Streptomyces sp. NPDC046324 TaxID=3154915 RepID=UPI0033D88859